MQVSQRYLSCVGGMNYSPRELVTDHFHIHLFAHAEPDGANKVLVDPRLKLSHPDKIYQQSYFDVARKLMKCVEKSNRR